MCASDAVVTNIDYSADRVIVTAADGTQYRGKYVILTSSLGVLKKGSISFTPTLPVYKQQAIQNMVRLWVESPCLALKQNLWLQGQGSCQTAHACMSGAGGH